MRFFRLARRCGRDNSGAAALEYAVLAAAVSVILIVAMEGLGVRIAATLASTASLTLAMAFGH